MAAVTHSGKSSWLAAWPTIRHSRMKSSSHSAPPASMPDSGAKATNHAQRNIARVGEGDTY